MVSAIASDVLSDKAVTRPYCGHGDSPPTVEQSDAVFTLLSHLKTSIPVAGSESE
jgi:hypothetical protein